MKKGYIIPVLDNGEIEIIDGIGNDLTVVNAARVSFGKRKTVWDENDDKLIKYLIKNKHFSPFRHIHIQLRIEAPEFVMRQLFRHVVGVETTSSYPTKDLPGNEISQRYVKINKFYQPDSGRTQAIDNKQGSSGNLSFNTNLKCKKIFSNEMEQIFKSYSKLLSLGVAKEQARIILPLNVYSEVFLTASWQAMLNFVELRNSSHAQYEIREYAKIFKQIMKSVYPKISKIGFLNDNRE